MITRGQAEEEKNKTAVKVEKILLLQGEKVFINWLEMFLFFLQFHVIHLYSASGDVQHTGSRWRLMKDVPSGKETFI